MKDEVFELPDKRTLGYALYGPLEGRPVIYFHGTPSSRSEPSLLNAFGINVEALLTRYHLLLIAVDRPGIGLSAFNPNGSFNSFADDVAHLLRFLKIEKTTVLCWSGGGPFALAIANRYPPIIQAVNIIAGFSLPFSTPGVFKSMHANKYYFGAARRIPSVLRFFMNLVVRKGAKKPFPQWLSGLPDVDHTLLTNPRAFKTLSASTLKEACRQGSKGAVYEAGLYFQDYGYKLNEIIQPVHFWWGTSDNAVTRLHAEAVEHQVPKAVMHYQKDEGHLSIYVSYFEEIIQTIAALE
ncbi:alpha/beta fold hydrolase [Segetibacter aerophilus]|uniref:Alpha/beta hydrolase n=1 Tax=Segetibacter aerophilus TaxID=670293 RepID=A0A512BCB4_9BACT|nr:alpha/beta hydrolase [Segetibacter aerophilus]GEO09610.1 alpha/beta hydrolase [Segetibacter aerophilus]